MNELTCTVVTLILAVDSFMPLQETVFYEF